MYIDLIYDAGMFCINEKNQMPALEALQLAIMKRTIFHEGKDDEFVAEFDDRLHMHILDLNSLTDVFRLFGALVMRHETDIIGLVNNTSMRIDANDFKILLIILEKFIQPGRLEARSPQGAPLWRWHFNGETSTIVYPEIHWPPLIQTKIREYKATLDVTFSYIDERNHSNPDGPDDLVVRTLKYVVPSHSYIRNFDVEKVTVQQTGIHDTSPDTKDA